MGGRRLAGIVVVALLVIDAVVTELEQLQVDVQAAAVIVLVERIFDGRLVGTVGKHLVVDVDRLVRLRRRLADDVDDLLVALHVDAGGAAGDDLDPVDLRDGDIVELDVEADLAGRALAVDQHIAGGVGEPAHRIAGRKDEARHVRDDIKRRRTLEILEIVGRVVDRLRVRRRRIGQGRGRGGRGQGACKNQGAKTYRVADGAAFRSHVWAFR